VKTIDTLFKLEHQVTNFHGTRHEPLATECHPVTVLLNSFKQHQYDSLTKLREGNLSVTAGVFESL
jgi:hypothetical protein